MLILRLSFRKKFFFMIKWIRFFLELLLIIFINLVIYISSIDLVIFNRTFLQSDFLNWLFYLLPILVSFLLVIVSIFLVHLRLPKLILMTLSNIYLALSAFMITGVYCEEEKNLRPGHIGIVLLIACLVLVIQYKYLIFSISKSDRFLIGFSTIVILAELYLNLFSYRLFYPGLSN
jgi:hypothetical protein